MISKIDVVFFICVCLFSCNSKENKSNNTLGKKEIIQAQTTYFNTKHIIEVDELKRIIGSKNTKIVHFGKPEQFAEGHIPGAVNIWRTDIEDKSYSYNGMICSKGQLEGLFSSLGIHNEDTLIVYDAVSSCDAARLWWVLENYGFHNTRILNGGIHAWKNEKGTVTTEKTKVEVVNFQLPKKSPMLFYTTKEEMLATLMSNDSTIILDTRSTDEYSGIRQKEGAMVGGRIPKSILADWSDCVNYDGDRKFKSYDMLSAIYSDLIPNTDTNVLVYCHTGVRSAHTTYVLTELLGYKNVKNYDGSWTEWSHFEKYPKEKDSITTL